MRAASVARGWTSRISFSNVISNLVFLQTLYTYPENWRAFKAQIAAQYSGARLKIANAPPAFTFGQTNRSPAFLSNFPLGKVSVYPFFFSAYVPDVELIHKCDFWSFRFLLTRVMMASVCLRAMPLLTTVSKLYSTYLHFMRSLLSDCYPVWYNVSVYTWPLKLFIW